MGLWCIYFAVFVRDQYFHTETYNILYSRWLRRMCLRWGGGGVGVRLFVRKKTFSLNLRTVLLYTRHIWDRKKQGLVWYNLPLFYRGRGFHSVTAVFLRMGCILLFTIQAANWSNVTVFFCYRSLLPTLLCWSVSAHTLPQRLIST